LNLTSWFRTPAGEALRLAESRVLVAETSLLSGEVLVWASIFDPIDNWQALSQARLNVWQALERKTIAARHDACVVGQLSSLPYATGAVDALIIQYGFEEVSDLSAAISETARVLRNGGHALVLLLDPWSGLGVRSLLGKLPSTALSESVAIECRRLLPAFSIKLQFRAHGLSCERESRIQSEGAKARLLAFRKYEVAAVLPTPRHEAREPGSIGLVPASRTSSAYQCDKSS